MASVSVLFEEVPRRVAVKLPLPERTRLLDVLQTGGVELAHECGGKLACASCRIVVLQGDEDLEPASDDELDMLDTAGAAVRLAFAPAGCSGFRYRLEFADAIREDDVVFESRGVRIAVAPASLPHLQGTKLDLVQEGLARRLRFDNPNARSTCGCGESFGL